MELLIIRHALPVRRELSEGKADPPLAPDGHAQAKLLAEYLASERLDAIYASPMQRARETAAPLLGGRETELVIEPDVAEADEHSPEYVPVEELKAANDPRWQQMLDGSTPDHWMDPELFRERVITAMERIIDNHRSQRVAVVCHGAVINAYLAKVLGLDSALTGFFYPNYTSIHRVAAASSGERSILAINETAHLRGSGLPIGLFQ